MDAAQIFWYRVLSIRMDGAAMPDLSRGIAPDYE